MTTAEKPKPADGTAASPAPHPHHVVGFWRRHFAAFFRWLHIYLSMVSFALVFFFAVTGITLNHADWFYGNRQRTVQARGQVELKWVKTTDPANVGKLEIVEHLRRVHGIKGAVSDFRVEDSQCAVSFKGPGYTADAFINRDTGTYELAETRMGFVAIINDLHKGRDTGRGWSLLLDISAVLMTLVSITGLVLIYFVRRRRFSGLVLAVAGALLAYFIYVLCVP